MIGRDRIKEEAGKVWAGPGPAAGGEDPALTRSAPGDSRRIGTDAENAADDLVRLVLAVIDTLRQLMERQAIRRVESGALSDDEIERLGLTLLRLEARMSELKQQFGLSHEDLSLRFGRVRDLVDVLEEDQLTGGWARKG